MNCPSRVDPAHMDGWNQNPDSLNADATTRADLSGVVNARTQRDHRIDLAEPSLELQTKEEGKDNDNGIAGQGKAPGGGEGDEKGGSRVAERPAAAGGNGGGRGSRGGLTKNWTPVAKRVGRKAYHIGSKYLSFIGPGFMVAVAYIDPGELRFVFCEGVVGLGGHTTPASGMYLLPNSRKRVGFWKIELLLLGSCSSRAHLHWTLKHRS